MILLAGCGSTSPLAGNHTAPQPPPPGATTGTGAVAPTVYGSQPADGETETTPALKPSLRPVPPGPAAPLVFRVPTDQRVVFITIDDGWFPNQGVLNLMRQYHLPITAFLIQEAAHEHEAYWKEFLAAGGTIEDHTYSHPFLTRVSEDQDRAQIADPVSYFKDLGASPDELRPPYGDTDLAVQKLAAAAGIKYVVMWDAVMSGGRLTVVRGRPLAPGDIILLHWVPGLDQSLTTLLHILQEQHLGVASLTDALDGRPLRVVWLSEKGGGAAPSPATTTSVYGKVYQAGH